jgi:hypothetical protein
VLAVQKFCQSLLRRLGIDPALRHFYVRLGLDGLPALSIKRNRDLIYIEQYKEEGFRAVSDPVLVLFIQNGLWYPWRLELPDREVQCGIYEGNKLRLFPEPTNEFCRFQEEYVRTLGAQGWLESGVVEEACFEKERELA